MKKWITMQIVLVLCVTITPLVWCTQGIPVSLKLRFTRQQTGSSCGLAGLSSIMDYWGVRNDPGRLLQQHPARSSKGYSLGELKRIATEKGFSAFAMKGSFGFLKQQLVKERPLLVAMEVPYNLYTVQKIRRIPLLGKLFGLSAEVQSFSHFMVVRGINKTDIQLMDPMYGLRSLPRQRFLEMWSKMDKALLLVGR
ncbi:MAG: hypothetical protein K9J81_01100 [Desulfohalobiaceae bacterium]|nr:hypothetical protein [Desulfohalobiaceae bacterium]